MVLTSLSRAPRPALRPFVELLWASVPSAGAAAEPRRELVLPGGAMHLVFRLGGGPWRLYDGPEDRLGRAGCDSMVGGVRAGPYGKAILGPAATVGVLLRPGAVELLSGVPAGLLAGAHTPLEDLWRHSALALLRERLEATESLTGRLDILERALAERLPRLRGIEPLVAQALACFDRTDRVAEAVAESGVSHRHLAARFTRATGLSPKSYCRVRRFGRVLARFEAGSSSGRAAGWAEIAAAEGYADQAHLSRDFRALSGMTPGQYRQLGPVAPRHVPL